MGDKTQIYMDQTHLPPLRYTLHDKAHSFLSTD